MARHGHLNRSTSNAIATEPTTECRNYPHSASSTTKLQRRQYGMMTQHRRQRLNRLRTTLPSHNQLQKCAVLPAHRATDVINRDSHIFDGRRSPLRHVTRRHVTRRYVTRRHPIFVTLHSSTRHSSSTHSQRRYNSVDATSAALLSVDLPAEPGRPLFDRLVPISSSRCSPHHDDHRFNDCQ